MVYLEIRLNIQCVLCLVVEVNSIEKESVTPLLLNMAVKSVMVHHVKIALAMKPNAQVSLKSYFVIRTHISCLVSYS